MDDFSAFTEGERKLFWSLNRHGIRYMVVGLSAAVLQGANTATRDIDIWFEDIADPRLERAIRDAGGIWISGSFGLRPPQIGGDTIGDRIDVVTHMHGLEPFGNEYASTLEMIVDDVPLRVLDLRRIVASKRAAARNKDLAVIPALEEALAAVEAIEPDRETSLGSD